MYENDKERYEEERKRYAAKSEGSSQASGPVDGSQSLNVGQIVIQPFFPHLQTHPCNYKPRSQTPQPLKTEICNPAKLTEETAT